LLNSQIEDVPTHISIITTIVTMQYSNSERTITVYSK